MTAIKSIKNEIVFNGRSTNRCWFEPHFCLVPNKTEPFVIGTAWQLNSNDHGIRMFFIGDNSGKQWKPPFQSQGLQVYPLEDYVFEHTRVYPFYHKKTNTLIGIGRTHFTRDAGLELEWNRYKMEWFVPGFQSRLGYSLWNDDKQDWEHWTEIKFENKSLYGINTLGGRVFEEEDGTVLMSFAKNEGGIWKCGTLRIQFDGERVDILEIGPVIGDDRPGGICEPDIVKIGGTYLMTIRSEYGVAEQQHDHRMYNAISYDGVNWEDLKPWQWDNGAAVETQNTQQKWLKHGDCLYLVYTRINELSNGVFRSRAPLWISKVDIDNRVLVKSSEKIVFPQNGARVCNFDAVSVTEKEAWVMSGEWLLQQVPDMQKGQRFYANIPGGDSVVYNRCRYIGDLLLARIIFE